MELAVELDLLVEDLPASSGGVSQHADHRQPGREGAVRRAGRHGQHHRHRDARPDGRLRPLPRPQVRPDPAEATITASSPRSRRPSAARSSSTSTRHGYARPRRRVRRRARAADGGAVTKFERERAARAAGRRGSRPGRRQADEAPGWSWSVRARSPRAGRRSRSRPTARSSPSGKNADFDTLHDRRRSDQRRRITAVRLEALADRRWSKGGPGRAANGNFALTDFRLTAARDGSSERRPAGRGEADQPAGDVRADRPADRARDRRRQEIGAGPSTRSSARTTPPCSSSGERRWLPRRRDADLHARLPQQHRPQHRPVRVIVLSTRRARRTGPRRPAAEVARAARRVPADKRTAEQTAAAARLVSPRSTPSGRSSERGDAGPRREAPKPKLTEGPDLQRGLPPIRLHTQGADFFNETSLPPPRRPEPEAGAAAAGFLQVLMPDAEAEAPGRVDAAGGLRDQLPPRGAGELDHRHRTRGRAPAGPRDRQSPLAASLRPRHRRHAERLRRAGRAADASRAARLAGRRADSRAAGGSSRSTG